MRAIVPAALLGLALSLTACGVRSELTPKQEAEYEALTAEKAQLAKRRSKAKARSQRAFTDLGQAEKKKKVAFRNVAVCGAEAKGQSFGPFPWGQKKRARLKSKGAVKVAGVSCGAYRVEVVK